MAVMWSQLDSKFRWFPAVSQYVSATDSTRGLCHVALVYNDTKTRCVVYIGLAGNTQSPQSTAATCCGLVPRQVTQQIVRHDMRSLW